MGILAYVSDKLGYSISEQMVELILVLTAINTDGRLRI